MASSSSSQGKHDAFLSFRGEDTRYGFTSNLYRALREKNIQTYMDDQKLESGQEISPQLMKAIRESKIWIIIFSKDFASSTWCLDEVVKILECKSDGNVIPIFYEIEPSIVRKQEDSYGVAFAKHEHRFKDRMDKVQQWRDALKEVAALSGYDSKNFRPEYMLVQKIVEDVLLKLPKYHLTNDNFKGSLIGIEERIMEIELLFCSMDVRIIGIWGMGGIGKTTLASMAFQKFSCSPFDGYCFLKDVREESERHGINHLRNKLLSVLLKDDTIINTDTPFVVSTFIQDRFHHKKVLVVLDDVDSVSTLQYLLDGFDHFVDGSRIIVTSRDVQLLRTMADKIYEVKRLNDFEALELFRLHAFRKNSDLVADYETLSKEVANYADGNPLALKVLGSLVYSKSKKEWESALGKLQIGPNKDIQKVLKISFDGLGDKGIQDIFLDIACFFNDEVDREHVESILHRSEHSDATIGISVLIDKSLIVEYQKRLSMHALLRQMGKAIVCDENKEPGNRSRLWIAKDVCHVLERNTGSSEMEGMLLSQSELKKDLNVRSTAFSKMHHLRFLRMHFDERFDYRALLLKKELCKEIYLPSEENLVELVMRGSQLVEIDWNENQPIGKLKKLDLSHSQHLIGIPNLSGAISLETLNLEGCKRLVKVPSYLKNLDKLQCLDLSDCQNLKDGIEYLPLNIRNLRLGGTAIEEVPSSIGCLLGLLYLVLKNCKRLKSQPENIWKLEHLKYLDLGDCLNLEKLPEISNDRISSSLRNLSISGCKRLKSITELPSSLTILSAYNCSSLQTISSWRTPTAQDLLGEECCVHASDRQDKKKRHKGYEYRFDNCLKLDHNTRNNLIAYGAHRRILCAAQDIDDISFIKTVYPGDEIPEWFSYQTDGGNSIQIRLPPNWFDVSDPYFKIAFCAAFVLNKSGPLTYIEFEFDFKTNKINGNEHVYNHNDCWSHLAITNPNDHHVFISYQTIDLRRVFGENWSSFCSNVTKASFRVFIWGANVITWKINKCGFELLK
ncbi:TMV resistance protein N-like [Ziziphus jujuba]|uniref:ADP-ribosyl cyclase/cyclic ADP-ribose hydrolase n=1 Tax=Ziziphus jujuba TaxID=326968 RepID=A0ABM3I2Z9_ZIZJJ|nr:TMV resistance protein N-like [Ziziphus jujuba]